MLDGSWCHNAFDRSKPVDGLRRRLGQSGDHVAIVVRSRCARQAAAPNLGARRRVDEAHVNGVRIACVLDLAFHEIAHVEFSARWMKLSDYGRWLLEGDSSMKVGLPPLPVDGEVRQ